MLQQLQVLAAESQPVVPNDVMRPLTRTVDYIASRIPFWERNIEEVKLEFDLP